MKEVQWKGKKYFTTGHGKEGVLLTSTEREKAHFRYRKYMHDKILKNLK